MGLAHLDPLFRLGDADALGKGRDVEEELALLNELRARVRAQIEAGGALTAADLAIDGNDVIPLLDGGAGPAVGRILRALLDRVIEDPSLNSRDKLMPLAEELARAER